MGAGIALTVANRGAKKEKGPWRSAKTHGELTPVTVCCSRHSLSTQVHSSETFRPRQQDPLPPAPHIPRALHLTVESSVDGDTPVASTKHRFVAASLDGAMIFLACCIFVGILQAFGVSVPIGMFDVVIYICSLVLITVFYCFVFAISGRETAGQTWTGLRHINREFAAQRIRIPSSMYDLKPMTAGSGIDRIGERPGAGTNAAVNRPCILRLS
jgi:hypothetical protein